MINIFSFFFFLETDNEQKMIIVITAVPIFAQCPWCKP